jgi:hypothetical protein
MAFSAAPWISSALDLGVILQSFSVRSIDSGQLLEKPIPLIACLSLGTWASRDVEKNTLV